MMRVELEYHYTRLELENQYLSSNSSRKLASCKKTNSNSTRKVITELKLELVSKLESSSNSAQIKTQTRLEPTELELELVSKLKSSSNSTEIKTQTRFKSPKLKLVSSSNQLKLH